MTAGEPLDNGVFETYTLKVGQADARFTITENGQTILFDADEDEVVDSLNTILEGREIERNADGAISIDTFAVTHLDQDHVGRLGPLRQNGYTIQNVIEPDNDRFDTYVPGEEESKERVSEFVMGMYDSELAAHDIDTVTQVSKGDNKSIDSDTELRVLAPPDTDESVDVTRVSTGSDVNLPPIQANENGAVYKLDGEHSALFMGDMQDKSDHYGESWLIQQHDKDEIDLSADVLFVAHHGSNNATSEAFLDRVEPELAIISSDFGEQHGHPHDEVLKNLSDHDVAVSWTAGHGTLRTDLDGETTRPEPTTDLGTTDAADLAALKYYCRDHDVSPDRIAALTPDHLPEETPEWVADAAPMLVETPEEIVDTAITNAETVEEVRNTLDATPDTHDQLREAVQDDRDEHVTTKADVKRNREAYFSAKRAEDAYGRLPLHTRFRANLPKRYGGIDHPLEDVPDPEEIDGPRDVSEVPKAVRKPSAAEQRERGEVVVWDLATAEEAADQAVDTAETSEGVCRSLRETPGAHKDFLHAIETPNAHEANKPDTDLDDLLERTNDRERTSEQTTDRDASLSL